MTYNQKIICIDPEELFLRHSEGDDLGFIDLLYNKCVYRGTPDFAGSPKYDWVNENGQGTNNPYLRNSIA